MLWFQSIPNLARLALLVLGVAALAWVVLFLNRQEVPPRHRIRLAVPGFQSSALVLLAEVQGFFAEEGVDAALEFRATGKDCLDLVLKGQADFAVVFETPVVHAAMEGHKIAILTEVHRSDGNTAVVVRKDHGIKVPTDLLGKTIAAVPRTNAEFLLDLFLRSQLLDPAAITLLRMPIAEVVEAITAGRVDAAALWEPYLSQVMSQNSALFDRFQSSYYSEFSVLAGLYANIDRQQEMLYSILRALNRADTFFRKEGPRARSIVDKKLQDLGFFVAKGTWDTIDVKIGLSATLLTMLNEEAKWQQSKQGLSARIDMRPLLKGQYVKAVSPGQVTYE